MIVLGADMHKSSHTLAAIPGATGKLLDEKTAAVGTRGFDSGLRWARALGPDRVWALEDCQLASGSSSGSCSPAANACYESRPS